MKSYVEEIVAINENEYILSLGRNKLRKLEMLPELRIRFAAVYGI